MDRKFGRLEAVRLLDSGGMSDVWEAEDKRLGSRYAVKVFAYRKKGAEALARFDQEWQLLAKLDHPRVVRVYDAGKLEDGTPYFVMDLVLGPEGAPQTLAQAARAGADETAVARWYDDIQEGLEYIHAKGIVHRDLKLENVLVGPDGHAVLTDFGISRFEETAEGELAIADPVKTIVSVGNHTAPLMGSVGYMAPELEMGCIATPQSDWYALGVLVYRLLTGIWCDARTDLAATLKTFDPAWARILPKLLHANPAGRECPSFAATHAQLQADAEVAGELRSDALARDARHWRRAMALTAAAAAAMVAAMLWRAHGLRDECDRYRADFERVTADWSGATNEIRQLKAVATLFDIPADAPSDPKYDDEGNLAVPSYDQWRENRFVAQNAARQTLGDWRKGDCTFDEMVDEFNRLYKRIEADEGLGSLSNDYYDNEVLKFIFRRALEKLREM